MPKTIAEAERATLRRECSAGCSRERISRGCGGADLADVPGLDGWSVLTDSIGLDGAAGLAGGAALAGTTALGGSGTGTVGGPIGRSHHGAVAIPGAGVPGAREDCASMSLQRQAALILIRLARTLRGLLGF